MEDQGDEQLDFGEGEDEELVDNEDEHLLDEEAGYDEGPNGEDNHEEPEEDVLAGLGELHAGMTAGRPAGMTPLLLSPSNSLVASGAWHLLCEGVMLTPTALFAVAGDEDMQDVQAQQDAHAANGHEQQGHQQQQTAQQEQQGRQQDSEGGKKAEGKGKRVVELNKSSGKVWLCATTGCLQQQHFMLLILVFLYMPGFMLYPPAPSSAEPLVRPCRTVHLAGALWDAAAVPVVLYRALICSHLCLPAACSLTTYWPHAAVNRNHPSNSSSQQHARQRRRANPPCARRQGQRCAPPCATLCCVQSTWITGSWHSVRAAGLRSRKTKSFSTRRSSSSRRWLCLCQCSSRAPFRAMGGS